MIKPKRSRFALLGVLALALCVTVGLMAGAADAKKKGKKKKGAKQVTVSKTAPTDIPPASATQNSLTSVPLVVGKKAKGKVVSGNSVKVTFSVTEPGFTGAPDSGDTGHLGIAVQSPSGRQVFVDYPDDHNIGAIGPVTISPDSSVQPCEPSLTPPPPPCSFPNATLGPPYAGTMGDVDLAFFTGVAARGTWHVNVFNEMDDKSFTLGPVSLNIGLQSVPKG
ncbi:MAG TPA: hypothetical protein VKA41_07090 [Solirubrobacterales bacterium]|nr:hypothetical protein [Solirubrobacterales bacterium]